MHSFVTFVGLIFVVEHHGAVIIWNHHYKHFECVLLFGMYASSLLIVLVMENENEKKKKSMQRRREWMVYHKKTNPIYQSIFDNNKYYVIYLICFFVYFFSFHSPKLFGYFSIFFSSSFLLFSFRFSMRVYNGSIDTEIAPNCSYYYYYEFSMTARKYSIILLFVISSRIDVSDECWVKATEFHIKSECVHEAGVRINYTFTQ